MFIRTLAIVAILFSFAFSFESVDNLTVIEEGGAKKVIFNGNLVPNKLNPEDKINLEMDRVKNGFYGKYFWQQSAFFTKFQFIDNINYKVDTKYSKVTLYKNLVAVLEIEKRSSKYFHKGDLVKKQREYTIKK